MAHTSGGNVNLRSGVKIYDNDWYIRYRMEPDELADMLASWNISYVIAQSRYLPMQDSAVPSRVTPADLERYATLDDVAVRKALAERGIGYFSCLNICFDPDYIASHPEQLPIDQFGKIEEKQDWYIGVPPDRQANLAHKIDLLEKGVAALMPDVVHLGFIRWPGFWETWLPGDRRSDKPEYCYAPQTLDRFAEACGLTLDTSDPVAAAATIARKHRAEWTAYKSATTVGAIRRIRNAVRAVKGDVEISINTLPFFADDFDHCVTEVFGQDVRALAEVVDVFEVMAYHQIMAREAEWPANVATDIRERSGAKAICTVQAKAIYLEGMHAGRGRSPLIDGPEFSRMLDAVETSPVEGLCVFTLNDLMSIRGSPDGQAIVDRLTRFRR
ncbi:hypothetical protein [Kaistia algarum]|uniref:hypothetical protein n=1 Tax=Kaistia algarum TaxID=2083279 RepID=UPI00105719B9|nr:hypothetical protein [Kaistia algarum]MCX5515382.1 hypothetical protein [Kaistia algarum]